MAQIVDDMTHTDSDKRGECAGQGSANIVAALVGGMGGCAMIGQSVINVTSGGRGRLSAFTAGSVLLFSLAVLGRYVGQIPMPALVAAMIMVSIGTFSWNSIPNLRRHPWPSSVVMVATVVVVVTTHDLSIGVLVGVIFFAGKVQRMFGVERVLSEDGAIATYHVHGEIFFASVDRFTRAFQVEEQALRSCPYVFKYHYRDDDGIHEGTCQDWETEQTYFARLRDQPSEEAALAWMVQKFGEEYPAKGMALAMGTHRYRPDQWLINGVIRLNDEPQLTLL
jgi:SulP family sulfate permease